MGRIKTAKIKRLTRELLDKHPDKITKKFETTKESIQQVAEIRSKKPRNVIAGYAMRLKRQEEL